jgi:AcrR family transcriptional regulator
VTTGIPRPGGRSARVRAAALDATLAELVAHGYARLSVDAVAARSGVGRATLYRRWGGREGLVLDAVESFAAQRADVPNTGNFDRDLRLWTRTILRMLTDRDSAALVRAVFGVPDSPAVVQLRHRFWRTRLELVRPVVERAEQRGDVPAGTDAAEVIRHAGAPLYYRLLVLAEPLTVEAADLAAAVTATAARAGVFTRPRPGRPG